MTPSALTNIHNTRNSCRDALPCANMALKLLWYILPAAKPLWIQGKDKHLNVMRIKHYFFFKWKYPFMIHKGLLFDKNRFLAKTNTRTYNPWQWKSLILLNIVVRGVQSFFIFDLPFLTSPFRIWLISQ